MKVKFFCDSGANIHSCRKETIDTVNDLGLEDGEWESLPDEEKQAFVEDWANEKLEIGWDDVS
jgi:hypothetical protein